MTGKQIAENLRQNRETWIPYRYHEDGKYCVIGLKLHELGVEVEKWGPTKRGITVAALVWRAISNPKYEQVLHYDSLSQLQRVNDSASSVDEVIAYCEQHAETQFPVEDLAVLLKASPSSESQS